MCSNGVSHLIFADETIMEKMANPIMDFVHKQVVMALYAWNAENRLDSYRELLPIYLSKDWTECEAILKTIERAGLVTLRADGIKLNHGLPSVPAHSCGTH